MNNINNDNFIPEKAIEQICGQHVDKLSSSDKEILEFWDWSNLVSLSCVRKSNNERLSKLISYRKPEVEKSIDLRNFTILQKCLASTFKKDLFVNRAVKLVERFYETQPRGIKNVKYGVAFPMTPELLYYAMFLAKNEIVLEIGGASGEHIALLAFSEAKRLYMNDIVPEEVRAFKNLCDQLPPEVQKKIESILGNCLELLLLKPELKGTVGLLLCHNVLHFFNDQQIEEFMKLIKIILRPGGRAIFTVNACYSSPSSKKNFELYPTNTAWQNVHLFAQDYERGLSPVEVLFTSSVLTTPSRVSTDYQQYYLWLKDKTTHFTWVEDTSAYKALSQEVSEKLKEVVNKSFIKYKSLHTGSLRLVTSAHRLFNEENCATLFKQAGFEVEQTFLIKNNGHLYFGQNPYGNVVRIGIIIKSPNS